MTSKVRLCAEWAAFISKSNISQQQGALCHARKLPDDEEGADISSNNSSCLEARREGYNGWCGVARSFDWTGQGSAWLDFTLLCVSIYPHPRISSLKMSRAKVKGSGILGSFFDASWSCCFLRFFDSFLELFGNE